MWPFRRFMRLLWWLLCCLTLLALPLVVYDFARKGYPLKMQAWVIGGVFVILSFPISIYEVAMHTEYYYRPRLQRYVIRILWMVPIYAVDAWFALRFRDAREYLDPVRECYEAYVIYSFFAFLMAHLEDELGDVDAYMATKPPMTHFGPFKYLLKPWPMGARFLLECKKGVLNYVILRPVCTSLALFTDIFDKYGQGHFDPKKSYIYLVTVTNFSQLWALYCLAQLYWVCHKELAPIRPLSKFLCIKAVVFLTFWQGVIIAILVSSGIITDDSWSTYDQLGVASGIQDFLICIEMLLAALAHAYAFPPKDYMDPSLPPPGFYSNVKHMFDLRDVVTDVGQVVESHVDSATGAVKDGTEAVLYVPKVAAKSVAKGLKVVAAQTPDSFLTYLTADGSKKKSGGRRSRGHNSGQLSGKGLSEDGDEEGEGSRQALLSDSGEGHYSHSFVEHRHHYGASPPNDQYHLHQHQQQKQQQQQQQQQQGVGRSWKDSKQQVQQQPQQQQLQQQLPIQKHGFGVGAGQGQDQGRSLREVGRQRSGGTWGGGGSAGALDSVLSYQQLGFQDEKQGQYTPLLLSSLAVGSEREQVELRPTRSKSQSLGSPLAPPDSSLLFNSPLASSPGKKQQPQQSPPPKGDQGRGDGQRELEERGAQGRAGEEMRGLGGGRRSSGNLYSAGST